jgi:hypothetical protein
MTPKEAEKKYGKIIFKKMQKYLYGVTVAKLPNGEFDIPEIDLDNAYKEMKGEKVLCWD